MLNVDTDYGTQFDELDFNGRAPLRLVRHGDGLRGHRVASERTKRRREHGRSLSPYEAITGDRFWDHPRVRELDAAKVEWE